MQFSPVDAIRVGWETFKTRPWFFIGAMAILVVAQIVAEAVSSGVDAATGATSENPSLLGSLVSYALGILISMGAISFFLQAYDNPHGVELSALWHPSPYLNFFATSLLTTLAVVVGLLLLIVPGFIAMVLFMFASVLVIERGLGPINAMKASMEMTKGNRWPLFGFILLCMLIMLVGTLALVVGLLVAMPIVALAFMHAYRTLSGAAAQIQQTDARLDI